MASSLQTGLDVVKKATELDAQGKYQESIYFYNLSLQHFEKARLEEKNEQTKNLISQKMNDYANRVKEISAQPQVVHAHKQVEVVSAPPMIDWTSLQQAEKAKWQDFDKKSTGSAFFSDLENAMRNIEKATVEDTEERYDEALELYRVALEFFKRAIDAEKNPEIRQAIVDKANQYVSRAEEIKHSMKEEQTESRKASGSIKLEVSPAAAKYLEDAINNAEEASKLDDTGQYAESIPKYQLAVSMFQLAVKAETNENLKSMMKDKMVKYTARSEQLRQFLSTGSAVTSPIAFGLTSGQTKYKPPPIAKKHSKKEKKTWKKF